MERIAPLLAVCVLAALATSCPAPVEKAASAEPEPPLVPAIDAKTLPIIEAQLGTPPLAAPPVRRSHPARVVVKLEVRESVREISDGVQYTFWSFGGTTPGPMIRVRRGDLVELHLMNHPDNAMPHNIDLHAVTGPGGGATSTFTAPGHQTQFTFQAINEGVYIYHCATAPVGMHIANGMYGLIVVEPEAGWREVDREYYVVQGDFYTKGDFREPGHQPFDMQRAIDEDPAYVLFNGREGSLLGERALTAAVGETLRLFVGNGGPNLVSSFHVIGEIFDVLYPEGGTPAQRDVQTTLIPAGGAMMAEFALQVPGTFILVDHSIFRAFNKGALGMLMVDGPDDHRIYSGKEVDEVYLAERSHRALEAVRGVAPEDLTLEARMARGEAVYQGTCSTCHQLDGQGLPGVFPPLAQSDYLLANKSRAIRVVIDGLSGPIEVNGKTYNNVMPPLGNFTDHEIADVLTYVLNSFGNDGGIVESAEVAEVRDRLREPEAAGHP